MLVCTPKYYLVFFLLQSPTKYFFSTNYYKVLLRITKYYSVLQSTIPYSTVVLAVCTTKYYISVLQNTTKYYYATHETSWSYDIHFDSHNTWNVQYNKQSNLWDAQRNETTTFMFDSHISCDVQYIGGLHLCLIVGHELMVLERKGVGSRKTWNVQYSAQNNVWDTKRYGTSHGTWNVQ